MYLMILDEIFYNFIFLDMYRKLISIKNFNYESYKFMKLKITSFTIILLLTYIYFKIKTKNCLTT